VTVNLSTRTIRACIAAAVTVSVFSAGMWAGVIVCGVCAWVR
jgi:hypothetical protein